MPKKSLMSIVLLITFCFAGCNWFGTPTTPGGSTPGAGDFTDDRLQSGEKEYPSLDYDNETVDAENMAENAELTQGVRATYIPKATDTSTDATLQADRDKFNENAALQYEIVARTILYSLVGRYGEEGGIDTQDIVYEFYADTSLLPSGAPTSTTVVIEANAPTVGEARLLEGHDYAIERVISGLAGTYDVNTASWTFERTYSSDTKWNFNLGTNMIGDNYNETFVETFTPYVQLNLMEYALGYPLTSYETMEFLGPTAIRVAINEAVYQIDKLGITANKDYADFLYTYIQDTIIGTTAINREAASISYTEPSYTYEVETPGENPEDPPVVTTETVYYDMDGTAAHTFTSSTIYKYDYLDTIREIVDFVAGTYDTSGNTLTPAISADFPTYTRLEITDIDPNKFFTLGTGEEVKKLDNMDYQEYKSVVWYPNGISNIDAETGDTTLDLEQKLWQFDMLFPYIDSKNDITLDIYLRLHIDGENYINHVFRIHTDSTQSFDYDNTSADLTSPDSEVSTDAFFVEDKTNSALIYTPLFFPDKTELLNTGIENTHEKTFYSVENAYRNVFAGKLGSAVSFGDSGEEYIVTNHFGEEVDLSGYYLCTDEADFVEMIFVPVYDHGEDYDYTFKFLLTSLLLGDIDLTIEE